MSLNPRAFLLALSLAACSLLPPVRAEDMPPASVPDPDLPQPFDTSAYLPLLQNPPFNRVVDYTDSLLLTGVAYLNGKPMATLLDTKTKKRYVVSEEPNAEGWRLADANVSDDLHGTAIKLQVGAEVVTIRYSESQLNPERKNKNISQTLGAPPSTMAPSTRGSRSDQPVNIKELSKDGREKFNKSMTSLHDKMSKMTDDQRAAYTQKIFNKIKTQDAGGAPTPSSKKASKR